MRLPFRKPDAFAGGARSHDEALAQARAAAPMPLVETEPRWARAWARVLVGQAPWTARELANASGARARTARTSAPPSKATATSAPSIWETLGITSRATAVELKRAFRQRALATHPDRGGDPSAFRAVQAAFKEAERRIAQRAPVRPRSR